jgi:diguanylate cyclase (GGDEF)-like protein/PAS domain S-box-containing protein
MGRDDEYQMLDAMARRIDSDASQDDEHSAKPLHRLHHFRIAFQLSPDAISINRARDGVYIDVNDCFCTMTGYSRNEIIGLSSRQTTLWYDDHDLYHFEDMLRKSGEVKNFESVFRRRDGSLRTALVSARLVLLDGKTHVLSVSRDIEALKQAQVALQKAVAKAEAVNLQLREANRRLEQIAITDGMTGLYNHRHLMHILEMEVAPAVRYHRRMAFIMLDVDFFKQVNDLYGHPCGDAVLKNIAQLLKRKARGTDIIARYGGDEFAVIMMEIDPRDALKVAEKIRRKIEMTPFHWEGSNFQISASIGVAAYHQGGACNWEELLRSADKALYRAKEAGRNRVAATEVPPALES